MPKLLFIAPSAGIALAVMFLPATGLPAAAVALVAGTVAALGIALAQRAADGEERALQLQREQRILLREEQVAHTAHELRTPLAALTTAVELLRDGYATTPEDQTMFLDQAAVAVRHMAFLVNDVVDLAAIESGQVSLHIRSQCVQDMLFDVAQVMQLTAQDRAIELRLEEPNETLQVLADRGRFLQVVFNLVANALKFSATGSTVRLTTVVLDREVRFEVHDAGPGIEADQRPRLFTRYGRLRQPAAASLPGTGLGLHVSKLLVDRMSGAIGYRPGEPTGSVFWFTLPLAAGSSAAVACAAPALA